MTRPDVYRPLLTQQDFQDIRSALSNEVERRLTRATKEKDPDEALSALQYRARVDDLNARFLRMVLRAARPKVTPEVEGQTTLDEAVSVLMSNRTDEEFQRMKEQAEVEEADGYVVDDDGGEYA